MENWHKFWLRTKKYITEHLWLNSIGWPQILNKELIISAVQQYICDLFIEFQQNTFMWQQIYCIILHYISSDMF